MCALTIPELAAVLDPPMSERQLRSVIALLRLEAVEVRHTGARGRPRPAYDARAVMQLHAALVPFLTAELHKKRGRRPGTFPGLRPGC